MNQRHRSTDVTVAELKSSVSLASPAIIIIIIIISTIMFMVLSS